MKKRVVRDGMFVQDGPVFDATKPVTAEEQAWHEEEMRRLERISTIDGFLDLGREETEKALDDIQDGISTPSPLSHSEVGVTARSPSGEAEIDPDYVSIETPIRSGKYKRQKDPKLASDARRKPGLQYLLKKIDLAREAKEAGDRDVFGIACVHVGQLAHKENVARPRELEAITGRKVIEGGRKGSEGEHGTKEKVAKREKARAYVADRISKGSSKTQAVKDATREFGNAESTIWNWVKSRQK